MAWSRSKLPDALAFTCGWPSTSVMSALCDSQGSPLLAGSAVHTWLACLVVWNHSFYCTPWSQSGRLDRAQIFTEPKPLSLQAHWLIWFRCLLFCAISFWIQHCRRVCRAHTSGDGVAWENSHVVRNVCVLGEGCYLLRLLSILTFLPSLSVYRGGWG